MGRVIARAWSDPDFRSRLIEQPKAALGELAIVLPEEVRIVVLENTATTAHLVLGAPPAVLPVGALSDIKAFAERYRDPRLFALNWRGRDPVATARMIADPEAELAAMGVEPPAGMTVIVAANTPALVHLVLPERPAAPSAAMLERLSRGEAPASLRIARLTGAAMLFGAA